MPNKKVLLVGNGINRLNNDYSWKSLLIDLTKYIEKKDELRFGEKPFPLLYEEIFIKGLKNKNIKEKEIKNKISSLLEQLTPNKIHKKIIKAELEQIITTNYDYCLENASSDEVKDISPINESRYSLFRKSKVEDKTIWHIHGELTRSNSILLGYEHYSDYLYQMKNYLTTGKQYKNKSFTPLEKRLGSLDDSINSWMDIFFKKDIYFLGLSLDFVEQHLWWLLTYRIRKISENNSLIKNNITYIYNQELNNHNRTKEKIELLQTFGINIRPIKEPDWDNFYRRAINFIEKQ